MPNQKLFATANPKSPVADMLNSAGGTAYQLPVKHHIAQLAVTGCFNQTYYTQTSGSEQLNTLKILAAQVDDFYLAKLAVYSRQRAFMKDMPAACLAILSSRNKELTKKIFPKVIDNGKVLRTFFQMIRSGQFGRRGFSTSLRNAVRQWLLNASPTALVNSTIGNKPTLRDVLRISHPMPSTEAQRALFGWIAEVDAEKINRDHLPILVKQLEAFRKATTESEQVGLLADSKVRWDLLSGNALGPLVWKALASQMGPQALRMNLNTLQRHGVLGDSAMVELVCSKLTNAEDIKSSKQFPYQYFSAYKHIEQAIPAQIRNALNQAAEIACGNIPKLLGPVVLAVDISGSMFSPVTGLQQRGATSKMNCCDVAAVFAAAMFRSNPDCIIMPFDTDVHMQSFDPGDTIMSLTKQISRYGGGTDCASPIREALKLERPLHGITIISDNESWYGSTRCGATSVVHMWNDFVNQQRGRFHTKPKLVCIDIQPHGTVQAPDREDVLNVGGFSDAVFTIVTSFFNEGPDHFVAGIEAIEL